MVLPVLSNLRTQGYTIRQEGTRTIATQKPTTYVRTYGDRPTYQTYVRKHYIFDSKGKLVEGYEREVMTAGNRGTPYDKVTYKTQDGRIVKSTYQGTGRAVRFLERETYSPTGQEVSRVQTQRRTALQKENIAYLQAKTQARKVGVRLTRGEYDSKRFIQTQKGQELQRRLKIKQLRATRGQRIQEAKRIEAIRKAKIKVKKVKPISKKEIKIEKPSPKKVETKSEFEKRIQKLTKWEIGASKRSERTENIFRLIPGLKGESFIQRAVRDALALPGRFTVGFGEQIMIISGKLSATAEGLLRKEYRKSVIEELGRAGRNTPREVVQAFDIRDPEKLVTLIAIAFALKGAKPRTSLKPVKGTTKIKVTKTSFNKNTKIRTIKQKGTFKNNKGKIIKIETIRKVNQKGQGVFKTTYKLGRKQIVSIRGKLKTSTKIKATRPSSKQVRKFKRKAIRKELAKQPKETKAIIKLRKKEAKKVTRQKATEQLIKEIRDRKIPLTANVRASIRKIIRKKFIGKHSIKPLKIPKSFFNILTKKYTKIKQIKLKKLRKLKRKQILETIRKEKQSIDTLIKNMDNYIKSFRKRITTATGKDLVKGFEKLGKQRKIIQVKKAKVKKSPFSPKERLKEISRLNKVDKQASKIQGQLQKQGQQTIQILKQKEIKTLKQKVKNISKAKTIKQAINKFQNIRKLIIKTTSKLKINQVLLRKLQLRVISNQALLQISLIAQLFKKAQKSINIFKIKKKQLTIVKQKQEIISIQKQRKALISDTISIARQISTTLATQISIQISKQAVAQIKKVNTKLKTKLKQLKKVKRTTLLKLSWDTKLKRDRVFIVNPIVRIKGKNREIRLNTTPNRALRRIIGLVDNTTARSFQLKIIGIKKGKDIKKPSLVKFRLKRSRGSLVLKFVEKSKYAIDKRGEKRGLAISRKLKAIKRRKPKRKTKRKVKRKPKKKR